jgi:hypothetical protein
LRVSFRHAACPSNSQSSLESSVELKLSELQVSTLAFTFP